MSQETQERDDGADNKAHQRRMPSQRCAAIVEDTALLSEGDILSNSMVDALAVGDVEVLEV